MLFNSIDYLMFLPIVVLAYYLIPAKWRYIWVTVISYYFYMSWNPEYLVLLMLSTGTTWLCGLFIEKEGERERSFRSKMFLAVCIVVNIGLLVFLKCSGFLAGNVNWLLAKLHLTVSVPAYDIVMPAGLSFYTLQAVGYMVDVYRGKVKAEKNLLRYAAFVSFFPTLISGPIERAGNLLRQMGEKKELEIGNLKEGLIRIAWGLFLKIVMADRIFLIVNGVYGNYQEFYGIELVLATAMFGVQIYCDFAGYSQIAIGTARLLGFRLNDNFRSPYLSSSVAEFWRRWHISLTSWFRDYVYIPLGGNRKGRGRKYLNTLIVFTVSGLWHGASWSYLIWGGLNGVYLVAGEMTKDLRDRLRTALHIRKDRLGYKVFSRCAVFLLIDLAWLFFRAGSMSQAVGMLKIMLTDMRLEWILSDNIWRIGEGVQVWIILPLGTLVILAVDYWRYKGIDVIEGVWKQDSWCRWFLYLALLFTIIIFGVYGNTYEQTKFIYFQF